MREIKFRIWDIETKQFFYWGITDPYPKCLTKDYIETSTNEYAGLKDKKRTKEFPDGQEIYEGDIVRRPEDWKYVVTYNDVQGRWFGKGLDTAWALNSPIWDELEIIDNIYENKELLK